MFKWYINLKLARDGFVGCSVPVVARGFSRWHGWFAVFACEQTHTHTHAHTWTTNEGSGCWTGHVWTAALDVRTRFRRRRGTPLFVHKHPDGSINRRARWALLLRFGWVVEYILRWLIKLYFCNCFIKCPMKFVDEAVLLGYALFLFYLFCVETQSISNYVQWWASWATKHNFFPSRTILSRAAAFPHRTRAMAGMYDQNKAATNATWCSKQSFLSK